MLDEVILGLLCLLLLYLHVIKAFANFILFVFFSRVLAVRPWTCEFELRTLNFNGEFIPAYSSVY